MQHSFGILNDDANFALLWMASKYDAYSKKLHGWQPYEENMHFWGELWLE